MILITKEEKEYLQKQGLLKNECGKSQNMFITAKKKNSKRKKYYIPELDYLMKALNKKNKN